MTTSITSPDGISKGPEKKSKNISFHLDFTKIYQFYEEQRLLENENKKKLSKSIEPTVNKKTQPFQKKDTDDDTNQITLDSPHKPLKNSSGFHKYKNNIELLKNLKEIKKNNNYSQDTNEDNKNLKTSLNTFIIHTKKGTNKSTSQINYSCKKSFVDFKVIKEPSLSPPVNLVFNDCKVTFKTNIIQMPSEAEEKMNTKELSIKNFSTILKNKNNMNNNILITNSVIKPVPNDFISRNSVPEIEINNNKHQNLVKNNNNNSIFNSSSNLEKSKEAGGKRNISVSPNIIFTKVKGISIFPPKKNVISVDNKTFKIIKANKN
jgi:hypothetical protein